MGLQEEESKYRYPHAKDYLDYVKYRKLVHFKRLDHPKVCVPSRVPAAVVVLF